MKAKRRKSKGCIYFKLKLRTDERTVSVGQKGREFYAERKEANVRRSRITNDRAKIFMSFV